MPGGGAGGAAGTADNMLCGPGAPCPSAFVCAIGRCVPAKAVCNTDGDCGGDSYCCGAGCTQDAARCVPFGRGPGSSRGVCSQAAAPGYEPRVQCGWSGPAASDALPNHRHILSTIVAGPLPVGPGVTLVAVTSNCVGKAATPSAPGDDPECFGALRLFAGDDCVLRATINAAPDAPGDRIIPTTTPALADLDDDGIPEIVAARIGGGVVAYRFNPALQEFRQYWSATEASNVGVPRQDGPTVFDLDADRQPEVILGGDVFDGASGARLNPSNTFPFVHSAVIHRLPPSGAPHLFAGKVYRWDSAGKAWTFAATGTGDAPFVQIAAIDLGRASAPPDPSSPVEAFALGDLDGVPEVVAITGSGVIAATLAGTIVRSVPIGSRASPAVGDFDGDGGAEISVQNTEGNYFLVDPGCKAGIAGCQDTSIRWQVSLSDDGFDTSSSGFDFNADGRPELVHADQCYVRVHDGKTGETLFSAPRLSCTYSEYPTLIDSDGDGSGEMVVPSNFSASCDPACADIDAADPGLRCLGKSDCRSGICSAGYCRCTQDSECGPERRCASTALPIPGSGKTCRASRPKPTAPMTGFRIYRDALDRWAPARSIWNQHAFFGSNVSDTGTIPVQAGGNFSNFHVTSGPVGQLPASDLTVRFRPEAGCHFTGGATIFDALVCNRGGKSVEAGVFATFYAGSPDAAQKLCTGQTSQALAPGACAPITCQLPNTLVATVTVQVNDDGLGARGVAECEGGNNRDTLIIAAPGCPAQ